MLLSKVQRERLEEDTKFVLVSETASDNSKPGTVKNLDQAQQAMNGSVSHPLTKFVNSAEMREPQIQPLTIDEGDNQTVAASNVIEMKDLKLNAKIQAVGSIAADAKVDDVEEADVLEEAYHVAEPTKNFPRIHTGNNKLGKNKFET